VSRHLKLSSHLSTRQLEVLLCVIAGDTTAEIARYVQLSPSSVKRYIAVLFRGCGARCRPELKLYWADRVFADHVPEAAE
jgi:DNA-binding NarL/FixJ family response regulator